MLAWAVSLTDWRFSEHIMCVDDKLRWSRPLPCDSCSARMTRPIICIIYQSFIFLPFSFMPVITADRGRWSDSQLLIVRW